MRDGDAVSIEESISFEDSYDIRDRFGNLFRIYRYRDEVVFDTTSINLWLSADDVDQVIAALEDVRDKARAWKGG